MCVGNVLIVETGMLQTLMSVTMVLSDHFDLNLSAAINGLSFLDDQILTIDTRTIHHVVPLYNNTDWLFSHPRGTIYCHTR